MNPLNAKLDELKSTARAAGREAAELPKDEQEGHLIGAFARNVRGAWDEKDTFGWDAYALTKLLNDLTDHAYERALKLDGLHAEAIEEDLVRKSVDAQFPKVAAFLKD